METAGKRQTLMWLGIVMLVLAAALGTLFALVTTAAQAWRERAQAQWPQVTARVEKCGLDQSSINRTWPSYYIHCRLDYAVGAEQNTADIFSTKFPAPQIWQYPPNQMAPFAEWVNEHPPGTPIAVRYDPAQHKKIVLAESYMPRGGPHTPSNVKLLIAWAGSFVVLLIMARMIRPRTLG